MRLPLTFPAGRKIPTIDNHPLELTLERELELFGDDDLFDMANLPTERTGIQGTLNILTKSGKHAARVKYFEQSAGADRPSFSMSITDSPQVMAKSLPEPVVKRMSPVVKKWIKLNKDELLRFWNEGAYMDEDARENLLKGLKSV